MRTVVGRREKKENLGAPEDSHSTLNNFFLKKKKKDAILSVRIPHI